MHSSFRPHRAHRRVTVGRHLIHRCAWQTCLIAMALAVPGFSSGQSRWDKDWDVTVNGIPINVQSFTSKLKPAVMAKELVQTYGALSRFHLADGRLLLHGLDGDAHWVAQISGHPDGSQGYVSALYFGSSTMPLFARADTNQMPADPLYEPLKHRFDFGGSALVGLTRVQNTKLAATSHMLSGSGPWTMASQVDPSMAVVVAIQGQ